jgi:hypothetical protein
MEEPSGGCYTAEMGTGGYSLPILGGGQGITPRITSLLVKPASAVCNLDCAYCFYLDREVDLYKGLARCGSGRWPEISRWQRR